LRLGVSFTRAPRSYERQRFPAVAAELRRAMPLARKDNRWLRDTALGLPRVRAVQEFQMNLLELGWASRKQRGNMRFGFGAHLVPLLACIIELLPWLKQWHNDIDPEFGVPMGEYFEGFIQEESRNMGKTLDEIKAWQPPQRSRGRAAKKNK
jgi:hypothetical protein